MRIPEFERDLFYSEKGFRRFIDNSSDISKSLLKVVQNNDVSKDIINNFICQILARVGDRDLGSKAAFDQVFCGRDLSQMIFAGSSVQGRWTASRLKKLESQGRLVNFGQAIIHFDDERLREKWKQHYYKTEHAPFLMVGEKLNEVFPSGLTYLGMAAYRGDEERCEELLKQGADPQKGLPPACLAARNGHWDLAFKLNLDGIARIQESAGDFDQEMLCGLIKHCRKNNLYEDERLLRFASFLIDRLNKERISSGLVLAADKGSFQIMKLLLERRSDFTPVSLCNAFSILFAGAHTAIAKEILNKITGLLESRDYSESKNEEIYSEGSYSGTALHFAIRKRSREEIKVLLSESPELADIEDSNGMTPTDLLSAMLKDVKSQEERNYIREASLLILDYGGLRPL